MVGQQMDHATLMRLARADRAVFGWLFAGRVWPGHMTGAMLGLAGAGLVVLSGVGRDAGHGLAIMLAVAVAALVGSVAGFAFTAVCGAILFHFHDDPVQVVQIMMVCSIANQAAMTWAMRRSVDWRGLLPYLGGGLGGLGVGVGILLLVDRHQYAGAFGGFLMVYGVVMLLRRPVVLRAMPGWMDAVAGFLGGVTGGAAAFPSAFVTIWCGMKGWDKARQRAVVQPFILIMQVLGLATISLVRGHGAGGGFDAVDVLFVPASLLGTAVGLMLFRRMTDRQFGLAVNALLLVSGVSYLF